MQKKILILCFVLIGYTSPAQYFEEGLDTLDIRELFSPDIIIMGTKDSLFSMFGQPHGIVNQRPLILFKQQDTTIVRDTMIFYNHYDYYSKIGINYYEKGAKVYIASVDFLKQKNLKIYHPKIILERNLTLDDFQKIFELSGDAVDIFESYHLPYKAKKKEIAYQVAFLTGGKDPFQLIELFFDKNKKLRYIFFP